MNNILKDT